MTRADIVGGLLLAAGFAAALWEGLSFQFGAEFAPGPGFAPVWLSSIGIAIALLIAVGGWRSARQANTTASGEPVDPSADKTELAPVVATLVALAVMIVVVPWVGFVPAMLAFLLILTLFIQRMSWLTALGTSLGTVVFVYIVFVHFLKVPIPAGPLGV